VTPAEAFFAELRTTSMGQRVLDLRHTPGDLARRQERHLLEYLMQRQPHLRTLHRAWLASVATVVLPPGTPPPPGVGRVVVLSRDHETNAARIRAVLASTRDEPPTTRRSA
jgi:hypothetical protein